MSYFDKILINVDYYYHQGSTIDTWITNLNIEGINHIWTWGAGKMAPLRDFAKYLKNGLADLHETL